MSIPREKPKILAIVGPTASGKTTLSIDIARRFDGEIISADSRQIYRGMDIGTAKPKITNQSRILNANRRESDSRLLEIKLESDSRIPHYLIDIKDPDEDYTVAEFKRDATAAIEEILRKGKFPILVGGTGLYVKTVVENLDIPEIKANPKFREEIEKEIEEKGLAAVFEKLLKLDPEAAYIIDPKNSRRVVRALEVAITTGKPFTAQRRKNEPLFDVLEIGLNSPPDVLRARIDKRVDEMMHDGLEGEVKNLIKKYGESQIAFDAIGYREIIDYLDGKHSLEDAVALMKLNTWRYAKRQMTWFRKDKNIHWVKDFSQAVPLISNFLQP